MGNNLESLFHAIFFLQAHSGGLMKVDACTSERSMLANLIPCGKSKKHRKRADLNIVVEPKPELKSHARCRARATFNECRGVPRLEPCCKGHQWQDHRSIASEIVSPLLRPDFSQERCRMLVNETGPDILTIHLRYGDVSTTAHDAGQQPPCSAYRRFLEMYPFKSIRIVGEEDHPCIHVIMSWSTPATYIPSLQQGVCELIMAYNVASWGSSFSNTLLWFNDNLQRVLSADIGFPNLGGQVGENWVGSLTCKTFTDHAHAFHQEHKPSWLLHKFCDTSKAGQRNACYAEETMSFSRKGPEEFFQRNVSVKLTRVCSPT